MEGGAAARRVFLVGFEEELRHFTRRYEPNQLGMRVVSAAILRGVLGLTLRQGAIEYLGKISFGLYVFHVAALRIAGSAVAGLVLTVLAAALSYRFLESPFLRWKGPLARVESRPI